MNSTQILEYQIEVLENLHNEYENTRIEYNKEIDCLTNLEIPLSVRWSYWTKYADKIQHGWILGKNGSVLGDLVSDNHIPNEGDRGREYDWEYFLEHIYEHFSEEKNEYNKSVYEILDKFNIKTLDDFKEQLIKDNFGSYTHDW